jgi:hypothetical protein
VRGQRSAIVGAAGGVDGRVRSVLRGVVRRVRSGGRMRILTGTRRLVVRRGVRAQPGASATWAATMASLFGIGIGNRRSRRRVSARSRLAGRGQSA